MSSRAIVAIHNEKLTPDRVARCTLYISVGTRDLQVAIVHAQQECWLLEDHSLGNVRTLSERMQEIKALFDDHLYLKAGYWRDVVIGMKSHKFTLIPKGYYSPKTAPHCLALNVRLRPQHEGIFAYYHAQGGFVNVFAADKKIVQWLKSLYPKQRVLMTHQGSAFIAAAMKMHSGAELAQYALLDRGVLHVVVLSRDRLRFYNQFSIHTEHELLKYLLLVAKELRLSQRETPLVLAGDFGPKRVQAVRQQFALCKPFKRRDFLKFSYHFDEIPDHRYIDLTSFSLLPSPHVQHT